VTEGLRARATAAIVVLALVAILGGQALADRVAPDVPNGALTGQALGRAGFAYLTGLRQFGAALLWNRLEPQMHDYYGRVGLGKMGFMLPSVRAIVMLDPQFAQAYYVAPEILIDSGQLQAGMDLAKEGVENNPRSGLLLASYAELLLTRSKDATAALAYAERTLAPDTVWHTDEEQWDAMANMRAVFERNGLPGMVAEAQAIMDAIDADPNATMDPVEPGE
jgi:tetratricopeptide (TPR) repeat protein